MRKNSFVRIFVLAMLLLCAMAARAQKAQPFTLKMEVTYKLGLRPVGESLDPPLHWWDNHLLAPAHHNLVQSLLDTLRSGKLTAYRGTYPFKEKIPAAELKEMLDWHEDRWEEILSTGEMRQRKVKVSMHPRSFTHFGFHEQWDYSAAGQTFEKKVLGIILYQHTLHYRFEKYKGDEDGYCPIIYIPLNDSFHSQMPVLTERIVTSSKPALHTYLPGSDSLSVEKWNGFVSSVIDPAREGKQKIYQPHPPYNRELAPTRIKQLFSVKDTMYGPRLIHMPALDTIMILSAGGLKKEEVTTVQFHEEWYFDPAALNFHKEVKGLIPVRESTHQEYTKRGLIPARKSTHPEYTRVSKPVFYYPVNSLPPKDLPGNTVEVPRFDYFVMAAKRITDTLNFRHLLPLNVKNLNTKACREAMHDQIKKARQGEIAAYRTDSIGQYGTRVDNIRLSEREIENICVREEIHYIEDLNTGNMEPFPYRVYLDSNIAGWSFGERWVFDPLDYTFEKQVNRLAISEEAKSETGEVRGFRPVFTLKTSPPAVENIFKPYYLLNPGVEYTVTFNSNSSWEEYAIPPNLHEAIFQRMIDDARNGKIKVYADASRGKKLSRKEVLKALQTPNMYTLGFSGTEMKSLWMKTVSFHEDWHYDAGTLSFYKKVKGVTLMKFNSNWEMVPMFYVPLNR